MYLPFGNARKTTHPNRFWLKKKIVQQFWIFLQGHLCNQSGFRRSDHQYSSNQYSFRRKKFDSAISKFRVMYEFERCNPLILATFVANLRSSNSS